MTQRKDLYNQEEKKLTKERLSKSLQIFEYIYPHRWSFFIGMLLLVCSSLVFLIFPAAAGEMANVADNKGTWGMSLEQLILLLVVTLLLQGFFSFSRLMLFARVSEMGMADVRKALYIKMISLGIPFYEKHRVGELSSRITADISKLQDAFSVTLAEFLRQIVTLIGCVAYLTMVTGKLTLVMLATFPPIVIGAMVFGRYIRKLSKQRQDELAKTNVIVDETLQSIHAVKAFSNELFEYLRYGKSIDQLVKIGMSYARIRGLFVVFIITILFGGIFFVLYKGALLVQGGDMPIGNLFSFIMYTAIIGGSIGSLGNLYTMLAGAVGATERVLEILNQEGEIDPLAKPSNQIKLKGAVSFKNVSFSYPTRPDIPVLRDVSFDVPAGQQIALVGSSGAGKSTIVQLLLRFYDLEGGSISVDGESTESYDLHQFRQNIAIVPQEVILFGGTIRENIAYGKPDATEAELKKAAEQANALEFIDSFPDGLDTIVGERGIKLSGGQRQRIAIARAILRDPVILLLDEATSSLDAESERVVQEALHRLMKGRTSIIIAHRLATIREVDQIYVLDKGKIIEQGTHSELNEIKDGAYSNLAKLQFSE